MSDFLLGPRDSAASDAPSGMGDVLALPDEPRALVTWLMRAGESSLAEIVAFTETSEANTRALVDDLLARGFVHQAEGDPEPRYYVRLAPKKARRVPSDLWKALDE